MKREINNASDLKSLTSEWVNTFNFVQLEVLERMSDNMLFEYIRTPEPDFDEFLNSYQLHSEFFEYLAENEEEESEESKKEFCEDHSSFDNWMDEQRDSNYPMWNTCFEFKEEPSEQVIQAAIDSGLGVIEGMDLFNTTLFASGCGYSFYSAHWIPLFLALPWNTDLKEQVERLNIDYSGM